MPTAAWARTAVFASLMIACAWAQDSSTGAIHGTVSDVGAARIAAARVVLSNLATGVARVTKADEQGAFAFQGLPPGEYVLRIEAVGMAARQIAPITIDVGSDVMLPVILEVSGRRESVTVGEGTPVVETQAADVSQVIDERAIADLPLNGRRFSDLALQAPGVTPDPRGLTSASNGDLAFGGIRGFQTSFLVDGSDNNNGFFAQARGRYRAPYQFSNEVIQEFRVSSNTYGAELGRSGGAVINVATKSGSNRVRGSAFYYLRDSRFSAQNPYLDFKPPDRQHQFGGTVGGPLVRDRAFYFVGYDQNIFHVPTVVRFLNGTSTVSPTSADYETTDKERVSAAAAQLSKMGGTFRSSLLGKTAFAKLDWAVSARHQVAFRLNTSRYYGDNNVFFDPASPVTTYALSENGEERVATESASLALTSALSTRLSSRLRLQFSRDLQQSQPNSTEVRQRIYDVIDAFGRSSILPRETREHRLHLAETLSVDGRRHTWKFGADVSLTWIRNFFPMMFGGQYSFEDIKVDPFTFQPQTYGLKLTSLRAWAHQVPRYYTQRFGDPISHPDTKELAGFVQDTLRVTGRLALTLGLRYDLQTFRSEGVASNPLWPDSGRMPSDHNNLAPRVGFAYSWGERRPLVLRGGWGLFYTRIPQIYNSAVENNNGLKNSYLFLDNADYWDRIVFPAYPSPLVRCPPSAQPCVAPASVAGKLNSEVSAFAHDFRTPSVQQASVGLEKEVARRLAIGANYMYVHGQHLIRARDVNLPEPVAVKYPVYDENGTALLGYYTVDSFARWETKRSVSCPYPPCVGEVARPIPQLGAVNVFESAASSVYHGLTVSMRRRMTRGLYLRLSYTLAHAIDDGQDALSTTSAVQNSYSTRSERASSTTDQRQRFLLSWIAEPQPFHREHPYLRQLCNSWKLSGVVTIGSGRPVSARVIGDANLDGNTSNDRLPGTRRNSFTGPEYATTDLRLARKWQLGDRLRMEILAESFNLLNRINRRYAVTDEGFQNSAGRFVAYSTVIGGTHYPAHFRRSQSFLTPTSAYAPRQVQFSLRFNF